MGRILILVLGLAVLAFAVKYELEGTMRSQAETEQGRVNAANDHTRPRQQLDNVREKTHQFERDDQQRADDALKKSEGQ